MPTRREEYQAYLGTPAWYKRKLQRQAYDDHACVLCDARQDLQCHHRTYEHVFHELLRDLTTLCDECHREVTNFLLARKYAGQALPVVTSYERHIALYFAETESIDDMLPMLVSYQSRLPAGFQRTVTEEAPPPPVKTYQRHIASNAPPHHERNDDGVPQVRSYQRRTIGYA